MDVAPRRRRVDLPHLAQHLDAAVARDRQHAPAVHPLPGLHRPAPRAPDARPGRLVGPSLHAAALTALTALTALPSAHPARQDPQSGPGPRVPVADRRRDAGSTTVT